MWNPFFRMASAENSYVLKWSIKNFSLLCRDRETEIHSPEFSPENMEGTKWRLGLSSQLGVAKTEYIRIRLLRDDDDNGPSYFSMQFELSFQASDESPLKSEKDKTCFSRGMIDGRLQVKWDEVLLLKKDEYLPEDTLTVCCKMWTKSDSFPRTGKCFAQTVIGTVHLRFRGILEGFSSLVPNEEYVLQCASETPEHRPDILMITLQLRNRIFVYIKDNFWNMGKLHTSKLHLIDNAGNKVECTFCSVLSYYVSLTKQDLIDKKELYLPKDTLTFQVEMIFSPGIQSESMQEPEYVLNVKKLHIPQKISKVKQMEIIKNKEDLNNTSEEENEISENEDNDQLVLPTTFKDDMMAFYNDSIFHDVQLRIGTETVPAHKDVLRARSPVFKKMFITDMKEKTNDCIDITDLNLDTVKRMLLFLYTDTTGDLELQSAKELYFASDKYDILSLKQRCSIFMKQNLQPSNACEILVLADIHQDKELKSAVQEYILKHDKEIFCSNEWRSFMETDTYLAAEVMHLRCLKN